MTAEAPDARTELDLEPIIKLLQRDVPAHALPYFKALRLCVRQIEILREARDAGARLSKQLAEFGEQTGASPWT